jgi:hypothetical protein
MTTEEMAAGIKFQREAVMACCVSPRIVDHDGPLEDGEVRYSDLSANFPEEIDLIVAWVVQGSPDIPVARRDGSEVPLTEINSFRGAREKQAVSRTRAKKPRVRKGTV